MSFNQPSSPPIDSLALRLHLEQGYSVLANVDEESYRMPDEDKWVDSISREEDDDKLEELLDGLEKAMETHQADWQAFGGAFKNTPRDGRQVHLMPAPPLLALRGCASRILLKQTMQALKIIILIEQSLPSALSQKNLLEAGANLRSWLNPTVADSEEQQNSRPSKTPHLPILIDVILIGDRTFHPSNQQRLKKLVKRFAPRERVFIRANIMDSAKGIWSSAVPWARHWRRYLAHAQKHRHQSSDDILQSMTEKGKNQALISFGIVLGILGYLSAQVTLTKTGLSAIDGSFLFAHFLVPLVALCGTLSLSRLRIYAGYQAKAMLVGYLSLYAALNLLLYWPPSFGLIVIMATSGFLLWTITSTAAALMEFE